MIDPIAPGDHEKWDYPDCRPGDGQPLDLTAVPAYLRVLILQRRQEREITHSQTLDTEG